MDPVTFSGWSEFGNFETLEVFVLGYQLILNSGQSSTVFGQSGTAISPI